MSRSRPFPFLFSGYSTASCNTATLLLLHADWLNWYGAHSWVSLSTMLKVQSGVRLNLFTLIPGNDTAIQLFFWFFLVFAILLTIGLWARVSSVIVFICLTSLQQRNLFILHSGDTFLRVTGFFLMFAPAGAAFSIDSLLRGKEAAIRMHPPWAQRMIQFELALLYFVSFCWKAMGETWVDGTALYYITHLTEIQRFSAAGILRPTMDFKGWVAGSPWLWNSLSACSSGLKNFATRCFCLVCYSTCPWKTPSTYPCFSGMFYVLTCSL